MAKELKQLLDEAAECIKINIYCNAERHYDNTLFIPVYDGQDIYEKYIELYAKDEYAIYKELQDKIAEIEAEEGV